MKTSPKSPRLFESTSVHGRELDAGEVPLLQMFFDTNPEYFLRVNSRKPHSNEAQLEFEDVPPPHLAYGRQWVIGLFDNAGELVGVAMVTSDFIVAGAWHVGLFIVATHLHGQGVAAATYAALEHWALRNGAKWMRLNAVIGNTRAERFWAKCGFRQLRIRRGFDTGGRINDLLVLLKPLGAEDADDYLLQAPRDRPDSPLP